MNGISTVGIPLGWPMVLMFGCLELEMTTLNELRKLAEEGNVIVLREAQALQLLDLVDDLAEALEYFFPDWKKFGPCSYKYKAAEALSKYQAMKGE